MVLKTVAIVFVNDLFLGGSDKIGNICSFLIKETNLLSYQVEKVTVLRENENAVAHEIRSLSKYFDIVIVINELKNDVIFKALAKITCQEQHTENGLENIGYSLDFLPKFTKLLSANNLIYPVIYFQRIFVLKEDYVHVLFSNVLKKHLEQYQIKHLYTKVFGIRINGNNGVILKEIEKLAKVTSQENGEKKVMILSSEHFDNVVECEKVLIDKLGSNIIESFERNEMENMIYTSLDPHIQQALENIEKCLEKYGPENVFISFNGGKDCTVLLHLVLTVIRRKYPNCKNRIFCLYVKSDNAFKEQNKFIQQCEVFYNLEVMTVTSNIKEALTQVLLRKPNFKACFMGTRRTDPFCSKLNVFQMTDSDWPQIMRVSPLLDWHYSDIWDYLLYYHVPYCKLYDLGFTSLGNALNTIRNPCLLVQDINGKESYLPAYKMLNETKERSGRDVQQ